MARSITNASYLDCTIATADVTCLRGRTELAGIHVFDHPLAQRADGIGTHR